ncbi:pyridoxamine 5'-phosphate oxidase family protein [Erwinia sp. OPT-41]|uniref:Pyridoxamine 5'-phosphate oxidase family protein n=1 Tax=Erwinia plantamica TaxID=3237104 RepID=A0ABW7CLV1_9GAMM
MFHSGERLAQQKAGFSPESAAIYTAMPQQHQLFYAGLSQFYFSTIDAAGYPVAAVLQGEPGFVQATDENHLRIATASLTTFPGLPALRPGMTAGGLGLDFSNRRRNRVNGTIASVTPDFVTLAVQESFGNCPKYIQRRILPEHQPLRQPEREPLAALDADARYLIAAADTCFIASRAPQQGADISHRGGPPGFIGMTQGKLAIVDYAGNRYMNTLGNLLLAPRCALLIMDFHQGAALHIQGTAELVWPQKEGEERCLLIAPEKIVRFRQLLPAAGLAVEFAASTLAVNKKG